MNHPYKNITNITSNNSSFKSSIYKTTIKLNLNVKYRKHRMEFTLNVIISNLEYKSRWTIIIITIVKTYLSFQITGDIKEKRWALEAITVPYPNYCVLWAGPFQPILLVYHHEAAKAVLSTAGENCVCISKVT